MPEAKSGTFYDQDYFDAKTRQSLPHTREIIYPLAERTAVFLARQCRPALVLDLGCAKGFLVEAFLAQGIATAFGLDISLYAVAERGEAVRNRLLVADVQAGISVRSGCFDLITAVDLFEHLTAPGPVLREIGRVMSETGVAYVKICHPKHPNAHRDPSHVNVQPLGYWRRVFRQAGFRYKRIYEAEFTSEDGWLGTLKASVRRVREWAVIGGPADYKFFLWKHPHG